MNSPFPRIEYSGKLTGFTLLVIFTSRRDTPLLSHLSYRRDGGTVGWGWDGWWLRTGAGQEVVAKSPLTSDWHAPQTGRATRYDC